MASKASFGHLFSTGAEAQADAVWLNWHSKIKTKGCSFLNYGARTLLFAGSDIQRKMLKLSKAPNLWWVTGLLLLAWCDLLVGFFIIHTSSNIFPWILWLLDFSFIWLFPEHLQINFAACLRFFEWCESSYPVRRISSGNPGRNKKYCNFVREVQFTENQTCYRYHLQITFSYDSLPLSLSQP